MLTRYCIFIQYLYPFLQLEILLCSYVVGSIADADLNKRCPASKPQ